MQSILYVQLQAEFLGRAAGDLDIYHLARIHAIHSDCRPLGKAIHTLKIGVENDVTVKRSVLIANQKEAGAEQHDGDGNENPDDYIVVFHATMQCSAMNCCNRLSSLRSSSSGVPNARSRL